MAPTIASLLRSRALLGWSASPASTASAEMAVVRTTSLRILSSTSTPDQSALIPFLFQAFQAGIPTDCFAGT